MALVDLASQTDGRPVALAEIAERQEAEQRVHDASAFLDSVIDNIRKDGGTNPDPEQARLGKLLVDANDHGQASGSYEALILDSLLRTSTGEPLVNFERLGKRLLSGEVDSSDQKMLEKLAETAPLDSGLSPQLAIVLAHARACALSAMIGNRFCSSIAADNSPSSMKMAVARVVCSSGK
jgi:hypothetical protein